jgi:hypothetical protein
VYIHPALGLRLAQAKIEESRSRAQRASAVRAAWLERRVSGVAAGARQDRWATSMLARVGRSRRRRRSLRANAPRTTKG